MPEILTESFCERCGTRYTFESATPRGPRLKGLKVMSRGLKNFVLSDDTSMDEAMAAARNETDREQTSQQLDAFHKTFNFCMSCRQYTCGNCWNEAEGRCLSCAPHLGHEVLPAPFSNLGAGGAVTLTDNEAIGLNDRNGHDAPAAATAPSEHMAWPDPEPMAWPTSDLMREQELAAGGLSSFEEAIDAAARLEAVSGPVEAPPVEVPPVEVPPAEDIALPQTIAAAAETEEPLPLAEGDPDPTAHAAAAAANTTDLLHRFRPADTAEAELAAYESEQSAAAGAAAAEAAAAQARAEEAAAAQARAEAEAAAQARAQEAAEAAAAQARAEQVAAAAVAEARALEEAEAAAAQARVAEAAAAQARAEEEAAAQARAQEAAEAAAAQAKAEEAAAAAARAQEAADAAAAQARAQQAADAAAAQTRAEEAAAQARAQEAAEAAAARARADEEAAEAAAARARADEEAAAAEAAAAGEPHDDLMSQPTWQIVAPEAPTTDQVPTSTPGAPAPAAPPDTIAARAEPQWPAQPEWPRAPSADGLPFLGRPAAATGGIDALWAESAREVANVGPATSPKVMGGVQPCVSCGLSLSANARFCRRCGTRQG